MPTLAIISFSIIFIGLAAASLSDIRDRIIPNYTVALVAGGGVLARLSLAPQLAWISFAVGVLVFTALSGLYSMRLIGGGDVKLIAASTLSVSPDRLPSLLLATAVAGGILGIVYLVAAALVADESPSLKVAGRGEGSFWRREAGRIRSRASIPYGLATFAGVLWCVVREARQ